MDNIFFNANHSPIGAYASFTLGYKGKNSGLGMEIGKPADQNIFIGLESRQRGNYNIFPFYEETEDESKRFDVENSSSDKAEKLLNKYDDKDIKRDYKLCSDSFLAEDLTFTIYSPVVSVPDPSLCSMRELKKAIVPSVFVKIKIDNSKCNIKRRAFFGFQNNDASCNLRRIDDVTNGRIIGIGSGRKTSITTKDKSIKSALGFSMEQILCEKIYENYGFGLGDTGALIMEAGPYESKTFDFAVSFYKEGTVTSGIDTVYYYTKYFKNIEDVADYSLSNFNTLVAVCIEGNSVIKNSKLTNDQKFLCIHSARSYYANTELLLYNNNPFYIVNEGEYKIINTFDLTVDQLFFELKMNPWTVRNELDMYKDRFSYYDKLCIDNNKYDGGICFTHDMGVGNNIYKKGHSAYERQGIKGCFSYMSCEELVNWICCAGVYINKTKDYEWRNKNIDTFSECFKSMLNRDNPNPKERNGLMKFDSDRVINGAEITTYDSLDVSLGQARNSLYLSGKCWACYVILEKIFKDNKLYDLSIEAGIQAVKCADSIMKRENSLGYISAVFENNNESKIIPAIEGLIFPYLSGCMDAVSENGRFKSYINALKKHINYVLQDGICIFPDGGWKLSSTSNNSWMSKIFLCQYIVKNILKIDINTKCADKAHVKWLKDISNSYYCFSDQMISGKACASRYYPRGVTSFLWLYETI